MTEIDHGLRFAAAVSCKAASPEGLERRRNAIAQAVASGLGPDALLGLVERHRVHALALDILDATGMEGVLGDRLGYLRKLVAQERSRCLVSALRGEQARRAIEHAGIRCLNFKGGTVLSRKLYGDLALRRSKDVDLIVHPEYLAAAVDVLRREGWKSDDSDVWFSTWLHRVLFLRLQSHFTMSDPSTGCQVELHHRFERIPDRRLESAWWKAYGESEGQDLTEVEFLYLVYHGTKHLWSLTKWLGDIAAVVETRPDLVLRALPLAREFGLEAMFPPLATLLRDLYGLELPGCSAGTPEGARFAASCIRALTLPNTWNQKLSERVTLKILTRRCDRVFIAPRVPFRTRASYWLSTSLIRNEDLEATGRFLWLFLPVLPLVRPCSWIWRRSLVAMGQRARIAAR